MGDTTAHSISLESERGIAVVGLSCRFAGDAKDPSSFWDLLCEGKSAYTPTARFDAHRNTAYGGYHIQEDVYKFDTRFFDISPKEAKAMDPSQRLMLEVAWEAFENAGFPFETVAGTNTSCYAAQFGTDYREMIARDPKAAPTYTVTGTGTTMLSNRLSWFFDLKGPSFTINTACSSSMVALHEGCESLRHGESEMALIAGANLILSPDMYTYLEYQGFLAPDGKCKSFDISANGYGRGEGVAALVLKPVQAAIRNGDPIRAIIRGSGVNQNGRMKGITLPSIDAQMELIKKTYASANLDLGETSYVEAHGTGTKVGDPVELEAIGRTIGKNRRDGKLLVGSLKPNIGHTEATAGLAGVIKSIYALETGLIPPNIYLDRPNPNIQFDEWNLKVPTTLTKLPREHLRRISVCSTGYGGTNAHVILDDAYHYLSKRRYAHAVHYTVPIAKNNPMSSSIDVKSAVNGQSQLSRQHQLFICTANDDRGIERQLEPLMQYCAQNFEDEDRAKILRRLAHTMNHKRSHFPCKAPICASSLKELHSTLTTMRSTSLQGRKCLDNPTVSFVFSGQGAQWAQMGHALYSEFEVFRESLDRAQDYFYSSLGCQWSVVEELFKDSTVSRIDDPAFAQPLTTVLQVALVDLLDSWAIQPEFIVGHSSGEIAGAYCLGALTRTQAWTIAYFRGVATPDEDGAMMAVGMGELQAKALVSQHASGKVVVACINSPQNVTLSGDKEFIVKLEAILQEGGIFARRLRVKTAYHSHHMQRIAAKYRNAISDITPRKPHRDRRMYSAVTGKVVVGEELGPEYWVRNLVSPVLFSDAVSELLASSNENRILVEIGPHAALKSPLEQISLGLGRGFTEITSVLMRGKNAAATAMNTAGTLYGLGINVDLGIVNNGTLPTEFQEVALLADLPPYRWKHDQSFNAITPAMLASLEITTNKNEPRQMCTSVEWYPMPELSSSKLSKMEVPQQHLMILVPSHQTPQLQSMVRALSQKIQALGHQSKIVSWSTLHSGIQHQKCISLVEFEQSMFLDVNSADFDSLRHTVLKCNSLLWVSPNDASGSIIPGLARTIRNEIPNINFRCLQFSKDSAEQTNQLSENIANLATSTTEDNEFVVENGRILVPRVEENDKMNGIINSFLPRLESTTGSSRSRLRSDATYLLVGGLGGLGRSLAHFLVDLGARHLCFVSRSGSASSRAQSLLDELRNRKVAASAYACDVSELQSLQTALEQCERNHPPIGGVLQCAMVLQDTAFTNMTHKQWQAAMRPKVQGSLNIATVVSSTVDFFVMLSSFTGTFGNRTQGNYVAACAFQDALAHECRARGENVVALDLGVMRDVGYLAEHGAIGPLKEWEDTFGLDERDLHALVHAAIAGETPTQIIAGLPTGKMAEEAGLRPPFFLTDAKFSSLAITSRSEGKDQQKLEQVPAFDPLDKIMKATTKDEAVRAVQSAFYTIVATSLQAASEELDASRPLHANGVDSLVGIEVQSALFRQLKTNIPINDLMGDAPMSELVGLIVSKCELTTKYR